jgi:hypothetical protein
LIPGPNYHSNRQSVLHHPTLSDHVLSLEKFKNPNNMQEVAVRGIIPPGYSLVEVTAAGSGELSS